MSKHINEKIIGKNQPRCWRDTRQVCEEGKLNNWFDDYVVWLVGERTRIKFWGISGLKMFLYVIGSIDFMLFLIVRKRK